MNQADSVYTVYKRINSFIWGKRNMLRTRQTRFKQANESQGTDIL